MVRPKKYFTKAQKKEANRAKNQKYYARNKDEINRRRREKHAKVVARLARKELKPWTSLGEKRHEPSRKRYIPLDASGYTGHKLKVSSSSASDETVKRAVAAARVIYKTYNQVIGGDPSQYCLNLCRQLFKDFENEISIAEARNTASYHSNRFTVFHKQVGVHYNTILSRAGIGAEFKIVEKMMKEIGEVVKMVEDIEACLLEGFEALIESFRDERLMFQM